MALVKLSPFFQEAQFDDNGDPLSGGLLYWYEAGTSTPINTYVDVQGITPQSNPIVLNSRGEPTSPIWLLANQFYKAVLTDTESVVIRTIDNIAGINDVSQQSFSEWSSLAGIATYVNSTRFTVGGDVTSVLTAHRRLKALITGGTWYGTITSSSYSSSTQLTTVNVANDSISLDTGLTSVYYSILSSVNRSIPRNVPFPPGTVCAFFQAAAPTGWTQITSHNDALLRVVSGTGGGAGGSAGVSGGVSTVAYHTHTYSGTTGNQSANHTHAVTTNSINFGAPGAGVAAGTGWGVGQTDSTTGVTADHTHGYSGTTSDSNNSGTIIFKYLDFVLASYNAAP